MGIILRFIGISHSMDICSVEYNSHFLIKAGRLEVTSGTHNSCLSSWNAKFWCKGSTECGIAIPGASHPLLTASQELSASLGTSGTEASASGSEATPDSTAGPWKGPSRTGSKYSKTTWKHGNLCSDPGSRISVELSSTRDHSQHISASLGSPWNSTGMEEQERGQMAKMSSHILSIQALQWHNTTWGLTSSFFRSSLFVSDEHTVL